MTSWHRRCRDGRFAVESSARTTGPDDGPLITYEALLEIIHIHLVDVYAASKHPTAPGTRLEMWQDSAAVFPPCIPASPDELLVLLSKRADRSLSPRGIELGGMFYTQR